MFEWHIPSCLEGHFLGIRRGVELHYEEVTFLLRLQTFFFIIVTFLTFFNVFYFYLNVFYIYDLRRSMHNNTINTYKVKATYMDIAVRSLTCHTATRTHMPYRITQRYLPPDRGDIPAFTPAEAGT